MGSRSDFEVCTVGCAAERPVQTCSFDKERGTMFSAGAAKASMMVAFEDCEGESRVLTGI
jgi:hypothetical protein